MSSAITSRLAACITSLDTVVAPAVAGDDPLATEQVRLVSRYVRFIGDRLDYLTERSYFELRVHLEMGGQVAERLAVGGRADAELDQAIAVASAVADGPRARPSRVDGVTAPLKSAISRVARESASWDDDATARGIATAVLDATQPLVDLHRVWFAPLGLEPHPPHLGELDSLL